MDVAIIGYGKMGHVIESVLVSRGHNIGLRIDPVSKDADATDFGADSIAGLDMVIEFSLPDAVLSNSRHYSSAGVPAVVGTTGWQQDRDAIAELYRDSGSFLSGSNFSIGAHVFFRLVASASNLISSLPQYDIMIQEIHHKNKKDSPSGTALTTAQNILKNHSGKTATVTERLDRRPHQHEVHVSSLRGGSMPGIHSVYIDSEFDTLELRHTARNRGGFALGAVLAAEWLLGKTGFFTVEDFIQDIFHDRGEK
ncbi:MAG: 4-hydroxy-tetrahydrodipicolinate reductase [Spirochaetales bacterium]|nr:4-hydroxy-tetrahydrodipicolinate reductase [Spirochaetales bacterium]